MKISAATCERYCKRGDRQKFVEAAGEFFVRGREVAGLDHDVVTFLRYSETTGMTWVMRGTMLDGGKVLAVNFSDLIQANLTRFWTPVPNEEAKS